MNSLQSSSTKRPPSALMKPPLACWANVEPRHNDNTNNKLKCRPPSRILPRAVSGSQAGFDATRRLKLMRLSLALHLSKLPPQRLHKMHCDFPQFTHLPCFLGTVEWATMYLRSVITLVDSQLVRTFTTATCKAMAQQHNLDRQQRHCEISSIRQTWRQVSKQFLHVKACSS